MAAASGGKFTSTTIALANPGSDFLTIVAAAGPSAETTRNVRLSISDTFPEGRGLSGTAFRTRQPCHQQRLSDRPRVTAFHAMVQGDGAKSGAAFPLLVHGQAVGVMIYMSTEKDTFTPEFAGLLQRLADNVSFALENFERADEKTKADERIEYLASHDSLTKLPNREMFNELLRHAIEAARAAISGRLRCCSSISTDSRSSTIRSVMMPATCCCWRSPTGCAAPARERRRGAARRRRIRRPPGGDRRTR